MEVHETARVSFKGGYLRYLYDPDGKGIITGASSNPETITNTIKIMKSRKLSIAQVGWVTVRLSSLLKAIGAKFTDEKKE